MKEKGSSQNRQYDIVVSPDYVLVTQKLSFVCFIVTFSVVLVFMLICFSVGLAISFEHEKHGLHSIIIPFLLALLLFLAAIYVARENIDGAAYKLILDRKGIKNVLLDKSVSIEWKDITECRLVESVKIKMVRGYSEHNFIIFYTGTFDESLPRKRARCGSTFYNISDDCTLIALDIGVSKETGKQETEELYATIKKFIEDVHQ